MTVGLGGMDANALQQKALENIGKTGGEGGAAGGVRAGAEAGDVARFKDAMGTPGIGAAPGAETLKVSQAPAAGGAGPTSMGDRILDGMRGISDKVQAGRAEASSLLGKKDVNQADLLKANFSMMESSTMVSAVAKTTEKITQSVETLQQG